MAFKFESLEIWQVAIDFSEKIFQATKSFPKEELFSLTSQLRRSADSIATNIAEGSGGVSVRDFQNYLTIAIKSCYETASHLVKAEKRRYLTDKAFNNLYQETELLVKRIIVFRNSLSKRSRY